jgi:hypothetical protein
MSLPSQPLWADGVPRDTMTPMKDEPVAPSPLTPTELRDHRWWVERFAVDDPRRGPVHDVDPRDLASTGWGVVFAPDIGPEVRDALNPLLEHRQAQAGPFFKMFDYEPGMTKQDFLVAQKAPPGPADPRHVPYYLLIVGDPRTIPFRFQYEMDVQYGVGRLHFERAEDYANYAHSVVRAETGPPVRPKRLTFFATTHDDDHSTERTTRDLVFPLTEAFKEARPDWDVRLVSGTEATKASLSRLLGGLETPALLFTATHGLAFPPDDPRLLADQGALVCQEDVVLREMSFSAADVAEDADLRGLVAFHFASFGGGTLEHDSFNEGALSLPRRLAPYPFVARLPQRLLSHPRGGALAVVSLIERGWTLSFNWSEPGQIQLFERTLHRFLEGHPVASAMEYFNQRYAELSVELSSLWEDRDSALEVSRARFSRIWRATHDMRSYIVLGDPAVRLTYRDG